MPVRILLACGTTADCSLAAALIKDLKAERLLADRGYDSDAIREQASQQGVQPQIPPRKNRKQPRDYDAALYRHRHLVENAILLLKRWRGIATRYAKHAKFFLAAAQIRCIASWDLIGVLAISCKIFFVKAN